MADNATKAVVGALLDTWSRGPSIMGILDAVSGGRSDLGPVTRGGDSVDVPNKSASTVNTSESASIAGSSIGTPDTMNVNRNKFINEAISRQQNAQLLGGGGRFASQIMRGMSGDLQNSIDRDLIDHLLKETAADVLATPAYHVNLGANAVTNDDVEDVEALIREQDGIANTGEGLFWLLNPRMAGEIKKVTEFIEGKTGNMLGLPMVAMINGIPAFYQSSLPGKTLASRQVAVASASNIATNVSTITVPSGHGFVDGQMIWTDGFTADLAETSPVAITSVTATTIVVAVTGGDGSNGTGSVYSASSMGMLCYAPWIFYGLDGVQPFVDVVKQTLTAGSTIQMHQHLGRQAHVGAVAVLHGPDGI